MSCHVAHMACVARVRHLSARALATHSATEAGIAVLPLILGLLLGAGSLLLGCRARSGELCASATSAITQQQSAAVLRQLQAAREMLLAYAIVYADVYGPTGAGPGHLPCPDLDPPDDGNPANDGPDPPCGAGSAQLRSLGRIPRLTYVNTISGGGGGGAPRHVAFNAQREWRDQRLWYRVSEAFVNNPVQTVVNPQTRSELRVNGEEVVAVVVAPGPRDTARVSGDYGGLTGIGAGYLEWQQATQTNFETAFDVGSNDVLLGLSRDRLIHLVTRRVQGWVQRQLIDAADYYCGLATHVAEARPQHACYPPHLDFTRADCVGSACPLLYLHAGAVQRRHARDHWFVRNRWYDYIDYRIDPECESATAYPCRVVVALQEMGFAVRIER